MMLHDISSKYEYLFDGTLVTLKTKPVDMELQLYAKPYHDKMYPIHRVNKPIFRD